MNTRTLTILMAILLFVNVYFFDYLPLYILIIAVNVYLLWIWRKDKKNGK